MSVEGPIAARATASIRAAVEAELPPEAWPAVAELVQSIDRALDFGDGATVARLTAELDAVRGGVAPPPTGPGHRPPASPPPAGPLPPAAAPPPAVAPPSMAMPAAAGPRRRRAPAVAVLAVVVVVAAVVALALGGSGDDEDAGRPGIGDDTAGDGGGDTTPDAEATTTTESFEEETTTTEATEGTGGSLPSTDPQPVFEPTVDVGVLELGADGVLAVDLTWSSGADLDLRLVEPDGTQLAFDADGPSATGAEHSGDTADECGVEGTLRSESVRWPSGGAEPGEYEIVVVGYDVDGCGTGDFTVAADAGADQVVVEQSVVTEQARTFRFLAAGSAPPPTPPPTTAAPPTTDDDRVVDGRADEGDDDAEPLAVAALVVAMAAAGGALAWVVGRRRLPLAPAATAVPTALAHLARPRLPVPAELRELANHTIHRLEVGPT